MTFEEAIDKIFLHQEEEDLNPGAYVSYDGLGAMVDIIRELEETYAPKIKMTGKELDFLNSRFKTNDSSGSKVFIDANGRKIEISPRNLQAWLHPELIEVSDD